MMRGLGGNEIGPKEGGLTSDPQRSRLVNHNGELPRLKMGRPFAITSIRGRPRKSQLATILPTRSGGRNENDVALGRPLGLAPMANFLEG